MQIKSKAKKTYHFLERKNIKTKDTWLAFQVLDSNGSFVFLMYCKSACKYLLLKIQISALKNCLFKLSVLCDEQQMVCYILAFSTALLIHR